MKRHILLNPGPVNIKEKVRKALLAPDMCHREPEFAGLMTGCARKLLRALGITAAYEAVFFTGSGTAALEAAVISSVPQGKKILVVNNGIYAERIAEIAKRHGIGLVNFRSDTAKPPDIYAVEESLRKDRDIAVVAMVHHETSTGMLNPVYGIGGLCRKYKKLYLLDSISALCGEELDLGKAGIGLCVGTANKCIESVPGISFVLVKKTVLPALKKIRPCSLYLDIPSNLEGQKNGEPLFTPAVQAFYAFDAALDELMKEGVKNRIKRYKKLAGLLREGFDDAGLEYLIEPKYHSNTITALRLPGTVAYGRLHDAMKKKGFVIYAGQARFRKSIFRIANMGQITAADARRFLAALRSALKR